MIEQQSWQHSDDQLLAALTDSETRLRREYGQMLELLGELHTRNVCAAKGYPSLPPLLRDLLRISRKEANRRLAHAGAVTPVRTVTGQQLPPPLPRAAEAVRDGVLNAEHVEAIRRTVTELPDTVTPDERDSAEQILVQAAQSVDPAAVARLGNTIRARLDQDGNPPNDNQLQHPLNSLRLTRFGNGRLKFTGELDIEGAALLDTVLSPLAKPKPATDGIPDARSTAERYGDALVDALRLAANCGDLPEEGGERPTLLVTVSLDALREQLQHALLSGGPLLDARIARRLACDCNLIPTVLSAKSEPLDIGRKTRVIPTPIRRAVVLRDQGCAFPGCGAPARWCETHHITHWVDGGPTNLANLVVLCGFHHRLLHHSQWEVRIVDGVPQFTPPAFIDPQRRPRRNPIHPGAA